MQKAILKLLGKCKLMCHAIFQNLRILHFVWQNQNNRDCQIYNVMEDLGYIWYLCFLTKRQSYVIFCFSRKGMYKHDTFILSHKRLCSWQESYEFSLIHRTEIDWWFLCKMILSFFSQRNITRYCFSFTNVNIWYFLSHRNTVMLQMQCSQFRFSRKHNISLEPAQCPPSPPPKKIK